MNKHAKLYIYEGSCGPSYVIAYPDGSSENYNALLKEWVKDTWFKVNAVIGHLDFVGYL